MKTSNKPWFGILLLLIAAISMPGCGNSEGEDAAYPRRPIKLIVPFAAGGGSDTFGRIIQNAIEEQGLLAQPLVIVNVPGAGGTIGSRRVKNARPDGYTLLLLHEGIFTAKHSGRATYGSEAFEPIVGTGNATQVIAVPKSSPFGNLDSLLQDAQSDPDSIVFSANIGAPSHFAGLMLESQLPGARFRYTQNGGGAKRFAALKGDHAEVSAFSIAEYVQFESAGLNALAILGPDRHPDLPDLPTAQEQGFDVISQNMQFWWAPLGTPDDRVQIVADAINAAMKTPEVRKKLAEMRISDLVLREDDLAEELEIRNARIAAVSTSTVADLPNFPVYIFVGLVIVGAIAVARNAGRDQSSSSSSVDSNSETNSESRKETSLLLVVGFSTLVYVAVLQSRWLGFSIPTAVFVFVCGFILGSRLIREGRFSHAKVCGVLLLVGLLMSFGIEFLFTKVLVVDLP